MILSKCLRSILLITVAALVLAGCYDNDRDHDRDHHDHDHAPAIDNPHDHR